MERAGSRSSVAEKRNEGMEKKEQEMEKAMGMEEMKEHTGKGDGGEIKPCGHDLWTFHWDHNLVRVT